MSTMEDLEDLSTDSDDEEYIPEGEAGVGSDSSVSEGEAEPVLQDEDEEGKPAARTRKRKTTAKLAVKRSARGRRKRKVVRSRRGIPHEEEEEEEEGGEGLEGVAEKKKEEEEEAKRAKEKARIDDLWASFKRDAATLHKSPAPSKGGNESIEPAAPKKLKIQQTYDFAGEAVLVEKEVSADSREAKEYLKSQSESSASITGPAAAKEPSSEAGEGGSPQPKPDAGRELVGTATQISSVLKPEAPMARETTITTTNTATAGLGSVPKPGASARPGEGRGGLATKPGGLGSKSGRGGGLSAVLKSLGKKPKMSTLEKSGLDWEKYKDQHRLHDELAQSTKDGYLARQEFLQWSDQKQFELERDERLKRFKRLH